MSEILKHILVFFFTLQAKGLAGMKAHRAESSLVTGPGKYTACRRVRAFFRPELLDFTGLGSKGVKRHHCRLAELTAGAWAGWPRLAIYEK